METHGKSSKYDGSDGSAKRMVSPNQARVKAQAGLMDPPWIDEIKLSIDKNALTVAKPLLVQRIDRKDSFYYLVPFNAENQTVAVVILNANDGRFKECAKMDQFDIYPKVDETQAINLLATHLRSNSLKATISNAPPRLVWMPCEQTQSPYEPLWCIRIDSHQWFVDQNKNIHSRIKKIQMKGGGASME